MFLTMAQLILLVLLLLISQITAVPAGVIDASFSAAKSDHPTTLSNGTTAFENTTINDDRFTENWQYNDADECKWALAYIPFVSSECTEYCEADSYNRGYRFHRLRYHIKLSGNGQDPNIWCDNFKARMMYDCGVGKPDFFDCNTGRAPPLQGLFTWAFDGYTGSIIQKPGVNLRFDFSPWWEPRDAEHDCVRSAIREATCAGTVFTNGLRCIPTMYKAPDGAPELDESFVEPTRCMYNSEVPPEAT
ncbi:hypothetical protein F5Y06DRAFT_256928 [Hypoxylon sp. FL0890]|nr:hypothetical protein F5Y06DRAFT_256928 [Hypoxylon sp. FL0890]